MSFVSFQRADALHAREAEVRAISVTDAASCCEYFKGYFDLILNHKMFGYAYDIYADSIVVKRENGQRVEGIPNVELSFMQLCAAFPDLSVRFADVFAVPNGEDAYKVWMRCYLNGTNGGASMYGPPTGLAIKGDEGLCLSALYVRKAGDEWLITDELTGRPEDVLRAVCTGDASFADHLY